MVETEQGKAGILQAFHEGLQKGKNNNSFNDGMERGMDKGYDKGHVDGEAQGLIKCNNLQLQTIHNVVSQAVNDSFVGFMSEVGLKIETAVNNAFLAKGAEKGKLPRPRPRLLPKTPAPASTATASASASVSVAVPSVASVMSVENAENVYFDFDGADFPTGGFC